MSVPSTQIAAAWIKATLTTTEWKPLHLACVEALTLKWTGKSEAEIFDFTDDKISYIAEHLRDEAAQCLADGSIRRFEIDDEQSPYIKAIASHTSKVLDKLRTINPFYVEHLCSDILKKLGANSSTTQQTSDGGVDFIASNLNIVPGALTIPDACKAIVIGQTKRYKEGNLITETKVREFVGAAILRQYVLQKEGKAGPLTPFIFAFWTTSDFDPGAKKFARDVGLWFMDGFTFATYINDLGLVAALL